MIHPPKEYFPQIREMTQRLGVLWLDDEVMTGFGRLGEWFGYKVYDVTPDIMTVAKGLVSSALPAGGVIRVTATDPAAPEDIPAWCRLTGHPLLAADHPHYLIRRRGA